MNLVDEINDLPRIMINNFAKVRPFWLWVLPPFFLISNRYYGIYSDDEITAWINGRSALTILNSMGILVDGFCDIWNFADGSPFRYDLNNTDTTLKVNYDTTFQFYTFWDSIDGERVGFKRDATNGDYDFLTNLTDEADLNKIANFWTENATAPLTDFLVMRMMYHFRNFRGINSTRHGVYFQGR